MAAPITHIVLTEKIYDKLFHVHEKKDLFIGTSFPDIRYLGVIDRKSTHIEKDQFGLVRSENAFIAGMTFHAIVDHVREDLVVERGLYELMPKSKYIIQSLKAFEDIVLHDKISDWSVYVEYFSDVIDDQLKHGISRSDIERWHKSLQNYIAVKPNEQSMREFTGAIGALNFIDEILLNIELLASNNVVLQYIDELYDSIEEKTYVIMTDHVST